MTLKFFSSHILFTSDSVASLIMTLIMAQRKNKNYDIKFKISVVKYAEENSGKAAASHFSVDPIRVREWKKQKTELQHLSEQEGGYCLDY